MAAKRKPMSAATKAKLSKALKGKKHPHKGHKMSAAARAKLSKEMKGKHRHHKGHKESAATRAKIAAKLRARYAARHKARLARLAAAKATRAAARAAKRQWRLQHPRIRVLRAGAHHGLTKSQRQNYAELHGSRRTRRVGVERSRSAPRSRRIKRIRHNRR